MERDPGGRWSPNMPPSDMAHAEAIAGHQVVYPAGLKGQLV